jgi:hypothetical protein
VYLYSWAFAIKYLNNLQDIIFFESCHAVKLKTDQNDVTSIIDSILNLIEERRKSRRGIGSIRQLAYLMMFYRSFGIHDLDY